MDSLYRVFDATDTYLLSVFNASFGGHSPPPDAVDEFINDANAFVVQAAANVGQDGDSWSSSIDNVINVGAWNVDNENHSLVSNLDVIEFNDIFANGYVIDQTWGEGFNFGTSFAAPRVSAEIINFYNTYLSPIITSGSASSPNEVLSPEEITDITNQTINAVSTEIEVFVNELNSYLGPFNVLTDDFLVDSYPIVVPGYMGDQSYTLGEARHFIQGLENLELLDPLNLFEYGGTDRQDEISGFSNAAFFGFEGNDSFQSNFGSFNQIFVGGDGDDSYPYSGYMTVLMVATKILIPSKPLE